IADAHDAWRAACGEPPREAARAWLLGPGFDPASPEAPDPVTQDFLTRLAPLRAERDQPPYPLLLALGTALLPEGPAWEVLHRVAALAGDALPDAPAIEATRAWVDGLARAGGRDLLPPPDREGRLRLLTVHRAKGLEFDAVWLPNLGCQPLGRGEPVSAYPWAPEQVHLRGLKGLTARAALLHPGRSEEEAFAIARQEAVAERLRLLYVGLTRARRHLVLSCHTHGGKLAPPWHIQALAAACR
ncbi:MAG: 3'-5' exonuclease, partial [Candidatus Sericytochromatia bacterium]